MVENQMKKKFYTVKDFYTALGGVVTKSQIYKMINTGEIPTRKIGRKIVLSAEWVEAYLGTPCVAVKKINKDSI